MPQISWTFFNILDRQLGLLQPYFSSILDHQVWFNRISLVFWTMESCFSVFLQYSGPWYLVSRISSVFWIKGTCFSVFLQYCGPWDLVSPYFSSILDHGILFLRISPVLYTMGSCFSVFLQYSRPWDLVSPGKTCQKSVFNLFLSNYS